MTERRRPEAGRLNGWRDCVPLFLWPPHPNPLPHSVAEREPWRMGLQDRDRASVFTAFRRDKPGRATGGVGQSGVKWGWESNQTGVKWTKLDLNGLKWGKSNIFYFLAKCRKGNEKMGIPQSRDGLENWRRSPDRPLRGTTARARAEIMTYYDLF